MAGYDTGRTPELTAAGESYFPAKPLFDALSETSVDGARRRVVLGDPAEHPLDVTVCRAASGDVTIGLRSSAVDGEPLRQLARRLAE